MTVFDIITAVLLLAGIGVMIYALLGMRRLLQLLRGNKNRVWWQYLFYFALFFLLGYVAALALVLLGMTDPILILMGVIFFFWAVFVAIVMRLGSHALEVLTKTAVSNEQLEFIIRQRTDELNKASETLEVLNQTKADFINVMGHELRTPLTVIRGYNQLLASMDPIKNDPEVKVMVSGMLIGVDRMYEMINLLLDVARIDADVLSLGQGVFGVAYSVKRVCAEAEESIEKRDLTLLVNDLDDLPKISADPEMIHKLFYQLLMNAIKYTPDGGQIAISGMEVVDDEGKTAVEIVIRDTGIGIDQQHQEVIFEKFYRTGELSLHSSGRTKFKGGGAGLGLAIARGIAHAHGGTIWAESDGHDEEQMLGSAFHVRLPAVSE